MSIVPNNIIGRRITDANLLTLRRTAIADASVSVFDEKTVLGTPTSDKDGLTFSAMFVDGVHGFAAIGSSAGSTSLASITLTFTGTPLNAAGNINLASQPVCK